MSNLKIPAEAIEMMRRRIAPLDTEATRAVYREHRIPRAEAVKDMNKRYRWDLARFGLGSVIICSLYDEYGVNDTHIDSALRAIDKPV
jgi:hypothetical protein